MLSMLQEQGLDVEKFWDLVEYNVFAVQFRYEAFEFSTDPLDRQEVISRVSELIEHVDQILRSEDKEKDVTIVDEPCEEGESG